MSDLDIPKILAYLRPGEEWVLDGDTYKGLTWLSDTVKPTETEIASAWPEVQQAAANEAAAKIALREAAIAHAKSLGFTDAMITVMYPNLVEA